MAVQLMQEMWQGEISTVTIGAVKEEGGSRAYSIKIGGEQSLPCLFKEGAIPNKPEIAFEIWDIAPNDWPSELSKEYGHALNDPFLWAEKCVKEYKARSLCVRLQGAHPDSGDKGPGEEAAFIRQLLDKVNVPLIILGTGDDTKDNLLLPACSEAAKGERCLIGSAVQDNYKTIAVSLLADGHNIIAESPIDINIAKQLNILISDMGLPLERIVINPTIGALGYGLEYAYSIMERARLAALSGDKTVASPFVCFVGQEAWRAKEAKVEDSRQGVMWEVLTATALIQAGADLLVMRHPLAIEKVNKYIDKLCS
ncbi:MAG: acetyl-CoA decarbonylase/synthase complex subunit delta [Candidatus Omnitrophica bacterium CG08_land_8_20_14_0_20_41_16]|uniref:Acetyl-CoA decarbonylase/synthase complex subunit delta n=1 Tax=Candidatus Sherwoodlollariibacterium unditelluris TaxID=1974757 RepID=A0A2G9YI31_9BACT|nr:MAG: acetyl-CoA decarbonylase/synthase complex subunit delta [Candidatus Omnitrophica bacterium CG23_combo_of_CG06-09_8_20_14_all_41_10]PIS33554.1 MAG: acetyl-CoA decarbonylase/synthase complex subunit delta [Candidatus Omnitrophica bacterium CG08_land_8_20_14_0_20_41_16]